jgi:hypothetical protein
MKKIILGIMMTFGLMPIVFAQYYTNTPYNNSYQNYSGSYTNAGNVQSDGSYIYTRGCDIYRYDIYSMATNIVGSTCANSGYNYGNYNNNNYTNYNTNYGYNNYTYPSSSSYQYTQPTYGYGNASYGIYGGYINPSQQNSFQYINGVWTQNTNQYGTYPYNTGYTNTNYNNNQTGCYYMTYPYQTCY